MEIYWLHSTIFRKKVNQNQKKKKTKLYFVDFKNGGLDGVAQNCNDVG